MRSPVVRGRSFTPASSPSHTSRASSSPSPASSPHVPPASTSTVEHVTHRLEAATSLLRLGSRSRRAAGCQVMLDWRSVRGDVLESFARRSRRGDALLRDAVEACEAADELCLRALGAPCPVGSILVTAGSSPPRFRAARSVRRGAVGVVDVASTDDEDEAALLELDWARTADPHRYTSELGPDPVSGLYDLVVPVDGTGEMPSYADLLAAILGFCGIDQRPPSPPRPPSPSPPPSPTPPSLAPLQKVCSAASAEVCASAHGGPFEIPIADEEGFLAAGQAVIDSAARDRGSQTVRPFVEALARLCEKHRGAWRERVRGAARALHVYVDKAVLSPAGLTFTLPARRSRIEDALIDALGLRAPEAPSAYLRSTVIPLWEARLRAALGAKSLVLAVDDTLIDRDHARLLDTERPGGEEGSYVFAPLVRAATAVASEAASASAWSEAVGAIAVRDGSSARVHLVPWEAHERYKAAAGAGDGGEEEDADPLVSRKSKSKKKGKGKGKDKGKDKGKGRVKDLSAAVYGGAGKWEVRVPLAANAPPAADADVAETLACAALRHEAKRVDKRILPRALADLDDGAPRVLVDWPAVLSVSTDVVPRRAGARDSTSSSRDQDQNNKTARRALADAGRSVAAAASAAAAALVAAANEEAAAVAAAQGVTKKKSSKGSSSKGSSSSWNLAAVYLGWAGSGDSGPGSITAAQELILPALAPPGAASPPLGLWRDAAALSALPTRAISLVARAATIRNRAIERLFRTTCRGSPAARNPAELSGWLAWLESHRAVRTLEGPAAEQDAAMKDAVEGARRAVARRCSEPWDFFTGDPRACQAWPVLKLGADGAIKEAACVATRPAAGGRGGAPLAVIKIGRKTVQTALLTNKTASLPPGAMTSQVEKKVSSKDLQRRQGPDKHFVPAAFANLRAPVLPILADGSTVRGAFIPAPHVPKVQGKRILGYTPRKLTDPVAEHDMQGSIHLLLARIAILASTPVPWNEDKPMRIPYDNLRRDSGKAERKNRPISHKFNSA